MPSFEQDRAGWAWTAVIIFAALISFFVALLFLFTTQRSLSAENAYRIPAVCKPLADRYGVPEIVSREQAIELLDQLNNYSRWPGVRQCRNAVVKQWVFG